MKILMNSLKNKYYNKIYSCGFFYVKPIFNQFIFYNKILKNCVCLYVCTRM
ncbi:hypothetical protein HanPI659440_Chr15g0577421 [Helianthus annuus]|nr:hypothetical protein HanPI659440_Chr15g0577421 [Helianthus annuus]